MVDLRPDQLATVRAILEAEVPECEVWAFGSRAKWTAKDSSDLDLALLAPQRLSLSRLGRVREAFKDSYLPIKVDVVDFRAVSDEFRRIIESQKVVLQKPSPAPVSQPERGKWQTLPLEDCVETIIDYRGKTPKKVGSGIPLITAKVVKGGRIETPDEFIAEEDYEGWMRRGIPREGDVLLTMEAPLGEVAQLDDRKVALAQRLVALRGKGGLLDNWFLKYLLQSALVQDQLKSRASGTTVLGIKQSELRKINLTLPPLTEQKAIARVLGALDDKIELNRRINETLEALARALFQHWFVDVTQAALPKGWRESTLGDLVELRVDRVEPTPEKDALRYIALEDMPSKSIDMSSYQPGSAVNSSITAFRKGDVLFGSMRPYFHKVGLASFDGITRTTTFVLRPKHERLRHFSLFHFFSNEVVEFATTASVGTTIPYVRWDALERYEIALPPELRLEAFEKAVAPLIKRIAANGEESRTLAALRDALLPKLLSGELRVPAA